MDIILLSARHTAQSIETDLAAADGLQEPGDHPHWDGRERGDDKEPGDSLRRRRVRVVLVVHAIVTGATEDDDHLHTQHGCN